MNRKTQRSVLAACLLALGATASAAGNAYGPCNTSYEVTITNLTPGQVLSPPLAVTHRPSLALFETGEPASEGLEALAEGGDTSVLTNALAGSPSVCDAVTAAAVPPGETVTIEIRGSNRNVLSVATMLVNTNDAFAALNGGRLPWWRSVGSYDVPAYDAGTEVNDELCVHVPGPACGGEGTGLDDGEGFVHIHNGIHDAGDLDSAAYDWRNPVATISVRRVR